ncbi:MAG: DcaP family trimeric outer membrane transporter [Sulfurimonas sp.]|uniref:DcaP family trimeric outer membrane transporter n=1 Tax=Sulfurimonas sp. TaxID=2022749 RepID=UPI0025F9A46D|nr:DcaP family trimeric outer membrane transporter [Sulfurimonas sp.]MCK9455409.1 porin [Sulfurimonas sp.]
MRILRLLVSLFLVESLFASGSEIELKSIDTVVAIGGRVHLSMLHTSDQSSFFAGKIALERDKRSDDLSVSARESRIWLKTKTATEYGVLRTLVEIDFLGVKGGSTSKNDYYPRLRHAFVELGGFGIGQTNSSFNSIVALDTISFPMDDTLVRQSLIRYTYDTKLFSYDISIEEPEITLLDQNSSKIITKDNLPYDFVLRARYYPLWGELGIAFLSRKILQENLVESTKDSKYGYGVNASGRIKTFGLDDIRFNAHYGEGSGRYIAYGAFSEGAISPNGEITLNPVYGGHLGYRHFWNQKLRSTVAFSYVAADNNLDILQTELHKVTKESYATQINLLWVPVKNLLTGVEYAWAKREVENGESGRASFLNLILRYDF